MIDRLLNRLHRVFNKEPQPYAAIHITSTSAGVLDVDQQRITITTPSEVHEIQVGDKTLNQILVELNTTPGVDAAFADPTYSSLLAKGLLPAIAQNIGNGSSLYMDASMFRNEMAVYAGKLQEQSGRLQAAEQQLYLHSAVGHWLDYWCKDYFGNPRGDGETDSQYRDRAIAEIIRITQNNKAMEIALKNAVAAVDCIVRDADISDGMSLQYDGSALYVGNDNYAYKYGSQPGCFYIATDLPSEDTRTLDQITRTLISTATKIKAAGTKLDGVVYKTSTSDTVIISETTTINAKDMQADILPWGLRYDGSVNHNFGRNLFFDGADIYNGTVTYNLAVDGDATYNNAWDTQQSTIHATVNDQQRAPVLQFNGLASYDGAFDQGAMPPPLYDTRMPVTIRRHNLYSGRQAYGADKSYGGSIDFDGSADFDQMRYEGIHTIQEITI